MSKRQHSTKLKHDDRPLGLSGRLHPASFLTGGDTGTFSNDVLAQQPATVTSSLPRGDLYRVPRRSAIQATKKMRLSNDMDEPEIKNNDSDYVDAVSDSSEEDEPYDDHGLPEKQPSDKAYSSNTSRVRVRISSQETLNDDCLEQASTVRNIYPSPPSPDIFCKKQPLWYNGYRYYNSHRDTRYMRWVCSRSPACPAKFNCDANGNNFVDTAPDHNHPKPKYAKSPSPEDLRLRKPLTYDGHRYLCKNKKQTNALTLRWYCSRNGPPWRCSASFICAADGSNFIVRRPTHHHDLLRSGYDAEQVAPFDAPSSSALKDARCYVQVEDGERPEEPHRQGGNDLVVDVTDSQADSQTTELNDKVDAPVATVSFNVPAYNDHQNRADNTRHDTGFAPVDSTAHPAPDLLRKQQPLWYKGFRYYHPRPSLGRKESCMRWVCSRYTTCKATFKCDLNGENFVDTTPDHNHAKPKFAKIKVTDDAQRSESSMDMLPSRSASSDTGSNKAPCQETSDAVKKFIEKNVPNTANKGVDVGEDEEANNKIDEIIMAADCLADDNVYDVSIVQESLGQVLLKVQPLAISDNPQQLDVLDDEKISGVDEF